jgi:hypothetical protein
MPGEGLVPKADENYFTPKTTQQWNKGSRLARIAVNRNPTGQTSEEEEEGSQRDDEPVGGAGDHGPGAGVDGVDIPLGGARWWPWVQYSTGGCAAGTGMRRLANRLGLINAPRWGDYNERSDELSGVGSCARCSAFVPPFPFFSPFLCFLLLFCFVSVD